MSTTTMHPGKKANGTKPAGFGGVPQLLNGDHLTVPEFERRYEAALNGGNAELIEGIVVMSPPISNLHSDAHGLIYILLKLYALATPGVGATLCGSLRLDARNEYQPDATLRIKSGPMARSKIASDGLVEGTPEFAAEVAVSSAGYDLHEKKAVYQRNKVQEYLVWQVMDLQIHWFVFDKGQYIELRGRADSVVRSRVFPGLWLNLSALLAGAEDKALRTLEKGLKSPEHAAFVRKLAGK